MTGVGFLNGIDGQQPDGVDTELVEIEVDLLISHNQLVNSLNDRPVAEYAKAIDNDNGLAIDNSLQMDSIRKTQLLWIERHSYLWRN